MAVKKTTKPTTKGTKKPKINGTDYDRFSLGGGSVKPAGTPSKYVKKK